MKTSPASIRKTFQTLRKKEIAEKGIHEDIAKRVTQMSAESSIMIAYTINTHSDVSLNDLIWSIARRTKRKRIGATEVRYILDLPKFKHAVQAEKRRTQAVKKEREGRARIEHFKEKLPPWGQPILHEADRRKRAKIGRSIDIGFEMGKEAEVLKQKATNLEAMARSKKGKTAKRRQAYRESLQIKKGDRVTDVWQRGNTATVLRVYKKSLRVKYDDPLPGGGFEDTIDIIAVTSLNGAKIK